MRVVAIVQARMGSSRLPGKVLAGLGGRPAVHHVLARAARIRGVAEVALAVPDAVTDDPLAAAGRDAGATVVRGDALDVLDRFHAAAAACRADAVVRLTADCPLLDPDVSSLVVDRFLAGDVDYASNIHPPTYPDGYDTEVIARAALDRAWRDAVDPFEREHVTPYVWRRPDVFRLANVTDAVDRSSWRLTLDTEADLAALRGIWARVPPGSALGIADVIALAAREPDLVRRAS